MHFQIFCWIFVISNFSVWSNSLDQSNAVEALFDLIHHNRPLIELEKLLRSDENLDINVRQSGQLWTPLIMAANTGNLEIVKLLLHYQADPNIQEADGFTALIFASHHSFSEIVEVLLQRGANIYHKTVEGEDAFSLASTEEMKSILQSKINDMEQNFKAGGEFLELCRSADDSFNEVKAMVERRGRYIINGEVNMKGWSSIHIATVSKNDQLLKFLLENGGSPNTAETDGWTPLLFASANKCASCVEYLVDFGALIGVGHSTAFEIGASKSAITGFSRIVELADNHGEIISTSAGAGLKQHLKRNRITTGKIFELDAGAIMNFVRAGANPNTFNDEGVTSLMLLCQAGEVEAARDLVEEYKADVNWQESDGWTSMMFAAHGNHLEIVSLLVACKDIKLDLKNKHGETAFDIAKSLDRKDITRILQASHLVPSANSNTKVEEKNGIFSFFGF